MHVRQMQVPAHKRQDAERHSHQEARKIEHFPGHRFAPADLFLPLSRCKDGAWAGFSTSLSRSTNSGASKIAPSSTRHLRVSRCLATSSKALLISGLPAN